jgi:hypothetical protein
MAFRQGLLVTDRADNAGRESPVGPISISSRDILMNNFRFWKLNISSIHEMVMKFMVMEKDLEKVGILPGWTGIRWSIPATIVPSQKSPPVWLREPSKSMNCINSDGNFHFPSYF